MVDGVGDILRDDPGPVLVELRLSGKRIQFRPDFWRGHLDCSHIAHAVNRLVGESVLGAGLDGGGTFAYRTSSALEDHLRSLSGPGGAFLEHAAEVIDAYRPVGFFEGSPPEPEEAASWLASEVVGRSLLALSGSCYRPGANSSLAAEARFENELLMLAVDQRLVWYVDDYEIDVDPVTIALDTLSAWAKLDDEGNRLLGLSALESAPFEISVSGSLNGSDFELNFRGSGDVPTTDLQALFNAHCDPDRRLLTCFTDRQDLFGIVATSAQCEVLNARGLALSEVFDWNVGPRSWARAAD